MSAHSPAHCPCGNLRAYAECCGRFHAGERADSPTRLMRSRYAAYVLHLTDYLLQTWHPDTRPAPETLAQDPLLRWLGLDVHSQHQGSESAQVEFIARFRVGNGSIQQLHEVSRFVRVDGEWLYLDGEFPKPPQAWRRP